jgi:UDPglucose 6-dehydrogenase
MNIQKISIIGAGYVGLTTAACFAKLGHTVFVSDVDISKIDALNSGKCPIKEPGLDELLFLNRESGNLSFTSDNIRAVSESDFVFLCLPTPEGVGGSPDMSFIRQVITQIRTHLRPNAVVVNKSTVPVGSSAIAKQIIDRTDIHVVSNPEFLKE